MDSRRNSATDPEWVKTLKPGWQAERRANFHRGANERFLKGEKDLIGDIWTELNRNQSAELEAERWPDETPEQFMARREIMDYRTMERLRGDFREQSKQVIQEGRAIGFKGNQRGRAYYNQGDVFLPKRSRGARTVVHEMGHWLEDMNPAVHDSAVKFLEQRTKDDVAIALRKATKISSYGPHEITKQDKFIDAYIGKQYIASNGSVYATEVVSMGLEYMYSEPVILAQGDPDFFDFIYNLARGIYK